jgi:serine/threonine protein kinase
MSLGPGTRIGPYEVVSIIGAGGMGEVYRAHDTHLNRDIALKILPELFAREPDRVARFKREAQVLASLNHPLIAAIYGFAEANGIQALALELVEGPTLADRIAQGPIPIHEALRIARQIAEALEAAHEQGIIHRDLKPANIKLREDGTVKVLDFGLAKALDPMLSSAGEAAGSPTITSPAMTQVGVILGTAAYMSPEQAKGRAADRRSDIWAFGCVLFEMLTGSRAFGGDDVAETVATVLKTEPDWSALPPDTPFLMARLLRRCLEKPQTIRLASMSAARFALDEVSHSGVPPHSLSPVRERVLSWRLLAVAVVMAAVLIATVDSVFQGRLTRVESPAPARFTVPPPSGVQLSLGIQPVAITPDGRRLIVLGEQSGVRRYYVKKVDELDFAPIPGSEGSWGSFTPSPDSQWIATVDIEKGVIRRIRLDGTEAQTLCHMGPPSEGKGFQGFSWGAGGKIAYASRHSPALMIIPDTGGTPQPVTSPPAGEVDAFPFFLPDGRRVLFIRRVLSDLTTAQVMVVDIETRQIRTLLHGTSVQYLPSGHLAFTRQEGDGVWALAFDAERLEVRGSPVPVLQDAAPVGPFPKFSVAQDGTLVYVRGLSTAQYDVVIVNSSTGQDTLLANLPADNYLSVRVATKGDRLALSAPGGILVYDLKRATVTPVTTDPSSNGFPLWTPDDERLVFFSNRSGKPGLYSQRADGSGSAERLVELPPSEGAAVPTAFAPDARQILFTAVRPGAADIRKLALDNRAAESLFGSEANEAGAVISPNGRWVAYQSNRSGHYEVYVERFPELGDRHTISTSGGVAPRWIRSGHLFYTSNDGRQVFEAYVSPGERLSTGAIQRVFQGAYAAPNPIGVREYDVFPDGKRFVLFKDSAAANTTQPSLVVVQKWLEELKKRVPRQ